MTQNITLTDSQGRSVDWWVQEQVAAGRWREETIPADVVGLARPMTVFRARRKTNLIMFDWHGDEQTFCPPMWSDLAIGSGACGLGCRTCFLMLTHRVRRDPSRHLLYDNLDDFRRAAERWLIDPQRRPQHTLGVGIDRSDSLLYERVAPHVHNLAPLFGDSRFNPRGNPLILLTKTANTPALDDIDPSHRHAIKVTFSLNPEAIADLWEGKREDGTRITPQVARRLEAARHAQNLGFEVRARIDPILTPEGWEEHYRAFFAEIKRLGIHFTYYTLGTFRQKNDQLAVWAAYWGLRPMEWQPEPGEMVKHGTHEHLPAERRLAIYTAVRDMIRAEWPGARVSLCKETNDVRKAAGLCNADCNCLVSPRARPAGERIPLVDMGHERLRPILTGWGLLSNWSKLGTDDCDFWGV